MAGSVLAVFKSVSVHLPVYTHDGAIEFGLMVKLLSCKLFPLLAGIEFEVRALLFVCDDTFRYQLLAILLLLVAFPFLCGPLVFGVIVVGLFLLGVDYLEQGQEGHVETAHHYVPMVRGKVE